ncbi:ty3-gypsy retrotransposon protein [Tanacetum coccineum]
MVTKLMGFDFAIMYKKGVDNVTTNALSRMQNPAELLNIIGSSTIITDLYSRIVASWKQDQAIQALISKLQSSSNQQGHYSWHNQQLRRKRKLMVGNDEVLRKELLQQVHRGSVGGHSGVKVTTHKLCSMFYWKKMRKEVKQFVRDCEICQRYKPNLEAYPGLLQPLPIPTSIWTSISMDIIDGLPKSQGKDFILVMVDRLSKYSYFMALSHPYTASQVAQLFLDNIYKLHGLPENIVSDRDNVFVSSF